MSNPNVTARGVALPFRFSDERTLKFVELYGREPCLWNKRPYLRRARNAAYRRIQVGINADTEPMESMITIQGIRIKIKNLRTSYHQELRKIRTIPGYSPKALWFGPLHEFLYEFVDTAEKNTMPAPPLKRLEIRLTRLKSVKLQNEIKPDPEEMDSSETPPVPPNPSLFTVLPQPMIMEQPLTPPHSLDKIAELNPGPATVQMPLPITAAGSMPEKTEAVGTGLGSVADLGRGSGLGGLGMGLGMRGEDEFTFFGLSVAAQIRNMPLDNAMVIQSKIQYMISMERRKINGHSNEVDMFN
ncbi:uncharacterized protein [Drosophila kikkawai]|uniref:MADF domain-containing protein n=1 Tax=Drosophila kikkawai TaxID=30033 RepID=A0A6P4I8B7_DROKI|nr:uncharacterized protein LOC108072238 [Drosophila kikkawai]